MFMVMVNLVMYGDDDVGDDYDDVYDNDCKLIIMIMMMFMIMTVNFLAELMTKL